jgi:hypothetical protein
MQNAPAVVRQHQKHIQAWKRMVGTAKKPAETMD